MDNRIRSFKGDSPAQRFVRVVVRAILLSGVAVAGFSTTAVADPIGATFQVTVVTRQSLRSRVTEPFSSNFELTLFFDDSPNVGTSFGVTSAFYGGLPSFSGLPREIDTATPLSTANITMFGNVSQSWQVDPVNDGTYFRSADADFGQSTGPGQGGPNFFSRTSLFNSGGGFAGPPDLSTNSLLDFLGAGDLNHLNFSHIADTYDVQENLILHRDNSYIYSGFAQLVGVDTNPAPEPATFVLFGSGLAAVLARSRRTRF